MISKCSRASRARPASSSMRPSLYRGSQGKRLLVLPDRLRQAAGPEVRIAQGSVLVGQLGGDMGREALARLAPDLSGASERGVRLGLPSQLVQHDGAVHQRLDVMRVERQGTVELREGLILLAHELVRQAEYVVRIGERAAGRHHLLEEVDGPVVVLQLDPLPGLLDQMLSADVHASPRTNGRIA